jgi:hypothetical protein
MPLPYPAPVGVTDLNIRQCPATANLVGDRLRPSAYLPLQGISLRCRELAVWAILDHCGIKKVLLDYLVG